MNTISVVGESPVAVVNRLVEVCSEVESSFNSNVGDSDDPEVLLPMRESPVVISVDNNVVSAVGCSEACSIVDSMGSIDGDTSGD